LFFLIFLFFFFIINLFIFIFLLFVSFILYIVHLSLFSSILNEFSLESRYYTTTLRFPFPYFFLLLFTHLFFSKFKTTTAKTNKFYSILSLDSPPPFLSFFLSFPHSSFFPLQIFVLLFKITTM